QARALRVMGRYEAALPIARDVIEKAPPGSSAHLEAMLLEGMLLARTGRYEPARAALEQAFRAAEVVGADRAAFSTAIELIFVVGYDLRLPAAGERWFEIADMKRERLGIDPDDPELANLFDNIATVYSRQG